MITKNGVCYDLNISSYRLNVGGLIYVFSSQLHLDKFKKKYKENRDIVNYSLGKRFNLSIDVSKLSDIVLYRKIESRGFLIIDVEGNKLCQKSLQFVGDKVIPKNSSEQ